MVTDEPLNATVPDEELVERARSGDAEAMDELVDRHYGAAYRVARAVLRDDDVAMDATQETFLKAFRALDGFRGEARFRTWLVTIAANEARALLRRVGRRREQALEAVAQVASGGPDPIAGAIVAEETERVERILARLPEKQRLAVQLRTQEGLSFREVGKIIGSSEGAARVNYHHGIRRLREMLE